MSGVSSFTWSCASDTSGIIAACAAPHQYIVTATASANGTLTCVSPVTGGNTTTCTADAAPNVKPQSISGCNGAATGLDVATYTTGAVTADCTVTATVVAAAGNDGQCDTAHTVALATAPSTNLCSVGTAAAVASGVNSFTWS